MDIYKNFLSYRITSKPCIFTLGNFDGIHLGHQYLFAEMMKSARALGAQSALLTFENHPAELFSPDKVPVPLIPLQKKIELIQSFGFDILICPPFTWELAALSADQFFANIWTMLPVKVWVGGEDVTFGARRLGNKEYLLRKTREYDFEVHILKKFYFENEPVSSTLIRSLIAKGDYSRAATLLGH